MQAKKKEENCCTADQLFNMAEKPLAVTFQVQDAVYCQV